MMAKTHIIFGVLLTFTAAKLGVIDYNIYTIASGGLGSLLPDIDHPKSVVGSRLWFISYPISKVFGHRGITHSLFAVALMIWVIGWNHTPWFAALAIGYLSHLIGDAMTPSGVPILYPSKKRYRFPIGFSTNSIAEDVFAVILLFVTGWMMFS